VARRARDVTGRLSQRGSGSNQSCFRKYRTDARSHPKSLRPFGIAPQRASQLIIQDTPNLSVSVPNVAPQNCFWGGMVATPPSDSALYNRSASAIASGSSDRLMPLNDPSAGARCPKP